MRTNLHEDPCVFRLAKVLKTDRLTIVGSLWAFWVWADAHAVDGRVDGADASDVDAVCARDGFASALVGVKWLEVGAGYLSLPKHDRHNGESAKERALKNQRQAKWRQSRGANVVDISSNRVDAPPSTSPSTRVRVDKRKSNTPKAPKGAETTAFKAFFDAYPKKDAKTKALEAFEKLNPDEALLAQMLAAIATQAQSEQWRKDGGQFIPMPASWLNGKRWLDQGAAVQSYDVFENAR